MTQDLYPWGVAELYPRMRDVIPEASIGDYRIEHFEVTEREANHYSLFNMQSYLARMMQAGKFCRLVRGSGWSQSVLMSDTHAERNTNEDVVRQAHGRVLLAGLGLGMIVCPIAKKPEVSEVVVVEISQEVIQLVEPPLRQYLGKDADKLKIVHCDIFEYQPEGKFSTIYFDIWGDYSGDEYPDTKTLHKKFRKFLNRTDNHFMDSWMRWDIKNRFFQNRRSYR